MRCLHDLFSLPEMIPSETVFWKWDLPKQVSGNNVLCNSFLERPLSRPVDYSTQRYDFQIPFSKCPALKQSSRKAAFSKNLLSGKGLYKSPPFTQPLDMTFKQPFIFSCLKQGNMSSLNTWAWYGHPKWLPWDAVVWYVTMRKEGFTTAHINFSLGWRNRIEWRISLRFAKFACMCA